MADKISAGEILKYIEDKNVKAEYVAAALTDEYILDYWPEMKGSSLIGKEDKILEIRLFGKDAELRASRSDISECFTVRIIDDADNPADSFLTEQFLDIDTDRSKSSFSDGGFVYATGGGKYFLPFDDMNDCKLIVKNYFRKDQDTGKALVYDWRLVGFTK